MKPNYTLVPSALAALLCSTMMVHAVPTTAETVAAARLAQANAAATANDALDTNAAASLVADVNNSQNTIGFNNDGTFSGTVSTRDAYQVGTDNLIDVTLDGDFDNLDFVQEGNSNELVLGLSGGGLSASFDYSINVLGNDNLVNSDLNGGGSQIYDLTVTGSGNSINDIIETALTSSEYLSSITGGSNEITNDIDAGTVDLDFIYLGDLNRTALDVVATSALISTEINGSSNDIVNGSTGASTTNTFTVWGDSNDIYVSQSASTSIADLTVGSSSNDTDLLSLYVSQTGTFNELFLGVQAGDGATLSVIQSAASSSITDNLTLAAAGSSYITIMD